MNKITNKTRKYIGSGVKEYSYEEAVTQFDKVIAQAVKAEKMYIANVKKVVALVNGVSELLDNSGMDIEEIGDITNAVAQLNMNTAIPYIQDLEDTISYALEEYRRYNLD